MKKIGEKVVVDKNFKIETLVMNNDIEVKKGDKGYVDGNGNLRLINGEGGGKIINMEFEINGFDHENIAIIIFSKLDNYFNLNDLLEYADIEEMNFIEIIEECIMDIL